MLTAVFKSLVAPLVGLKLCITEPRIRALAIKPWIVGVVSFILLIVPLKLGLGALVDALPELPPDLCSVAPCELIMSLAGPIIWTLASILATFFAFLIVIVGTGVSQWKISQEAFVLLSARKGGAAEVSPEERRKISVMKAIGGETFRQFVFFGGLIFWGFVSLFALFIPPLWIFPTLGFAWIFGYIVLDAVLEGAGLTFGDRFTKSLVRPDIFLAFGFSISILLSAPLLALILFPAAAAGAGWLVVELKLTEQKLR